MALAIYSATPSQEIKVDVPSGTKNSIEYTINFEGPLILNLDNLGDVRWDFIADDKKIKSRFRVKTNNKLVAAILGTYKDPIWASEVLSVNVRDNSLDGVMLENYFYKENGRRGELLYGFKFQGKKDGFLIKCRKNKIPTTCQEKPTSSNNPDLFAILAGAAYTDNLDEKVKDTKLQKAFHVGKEAYIKLKKIEERENCILYNVENIQNLLGKEIRMDICLRKEYPHLLEKAEILVKYGGIEGKIMVNKK